MADALKTGRVLVEKQSGYRILTLNRPQRLNAFDEGMHCALSSELMAAEEDHSCRAILLTGAGRGFCAGQDLADHADPDKSPPDLGYTLDAFYNPLIRKLRASPLPIVCAVNGVAAGAGANIALACDIVLAARSATFVQAFAKLGLVPDSGGTWHLMRLVGEARARGLAFLAEPLSAELAEAWGLIWKVVDDFDLMREAKAICSRLAEGSPTGLARTKAALNCAASNSLTSQLDLERDFQRELGRGPDYAEGVRAFVEKRRPNFAGRG